MVAQVGNIGVGGVKRQDVLVLRRHTSLAARRSLAGGRAGLQAHDQGHDRRGPEEQPENIR